MIEVFLMFNETSPSAMWGFVFWLGLEGNMSRIA
jgi:hypothetical protein